METYRNTLVTQTPELPVRALRVEASLTFEQWGLCHTRQQSYAIRPMELTVSRLHAEVSLGCLEEHDRETVEGHLIGRRVDDTMTSCAEVSARHDCMLSAAMPSSASSKLTLQGLANVDDQRSGAVGDVVPLLIPTPDLE